MIAWDSLNRIFKAESNELTAFGGATLKALPIRSGSPGRLFSGSASLSPSGSRSMSDEKPPIAIATAIAIPISKPWTNHPYLPGKPPPSLEGVPDHALQAARYSLIASYWLWPSSPASRRTTDPCPLPRK